MSAATDTSTGTAVAVSGLTRRFGERTVLHGLDLTIPAGQFVALIGASGCGKSTLLKILAGLDRDIEGEVLVAKRRSVSFQSPRLFPWKRVWKNVVFGLDGDSSRGRAVTALDEVGLGAAANVWPKTLSGGEAQRVALARALAREPELLLLDEPLGALDALTRMKAQQLVIELWQRHNPAVVFVTHDVEEALLLADRIVLMREGVIERDELDHAISPRRTSSGAGRKIGRAHV